MRIQLLPKYASGTCPECLTKFDRLPVEADEDGGYAYLETWPCHDDECRKRLCACCEQFACDACGLTFCMDHLGSTVEEDECRCVQTDVDTDDPRDCPMHDGRYHAPERYCRECLKPAVEEPAKPFCEVWMGLWEIPGGDVYGRVQAHKLVCPMCLGLPAAMPVASETRQAAEVIA